MTQTRGRSTWPGTAPSRGTASAALLVLPSPWSRRTTACPPTAPRRLQRDLKRQSDSDYSQIVQLEGELEGMRAALQEAAEGRASHQRAAELRLQEARTGPCPCSALCLWAKAGTLDGTELSQGPT